MSKHIDFNGKTALITGASRGIGAALAKLLAAHGAHVILIARTIGGLETVDDTIRAGGGKATLMPLDLSDLNALDSLGPTLHRHFPHLDMFVANAAMLGTLAPLGHLKADEWQKVMDLNVTANFRLIRTLDPLLKAAPTGHAVFVTSGVARAPRAYWGGYAVSKAALESLAKTYAAECEGTNVAVNIFDPGRVRTAMRAEAYPGEDPATRPAPEDIAPHILPLLSDNCGVYGTIVAVPPSK
jgi:NAD(P)-dependent dehydrogenase (short-subunit alcohol dehydrogenase family)